MFSLRLKPDCAPTRLVNSCISALPVFFMFIFCIFGGRGGEGHPPHIFQLIWPWGWVRKSWRKLGCKPSLLFAGCKPSRRAVCFALLECVLCCRGVSKGNLKEHHCGRSPKHRHAHLGTLQTVVHKHPNLMCNKRPSPQVSSPTYLVTQIADGTPSTPAVERFDSPRGT